LWWNVVDEEPQTPSNEYIFASLKNNEAAKKP